MSVIIGIIIGIVALVCAVIAFFSFGQNNAIGAIFTLLCIICVLAFIIVPFSIHKVDTGEIAVVKVLGKAQEIKSPGTYFDFWLTNKYVYYDAKVQNVDIETAAYSSDAQTMTIQMTLQYQIMSDEVMNIAQQYGTLGTLQSRIQAISTEKTKAALSEYKAMDIIANRAAMSPAVEELIREAIGEEYYVNVVAVVLTNIDFSDAFELAVEEKMIAEQAKLKADYENETKIAKAEADAEAKLKAAQAAIDIAKADAEAKKISAEADAEANRIIEESITDKILEKEYLEKWDGKLPSVVTGENSGLLIPTP